MTVLGVLRRFLGIKQSEQSSGLEQLQEYLRSQQSTLSLYVVYDEPTIDGQCEITAVFPHTIYCGDEVYGYGEKQFVIPDEPFGEPDNDFNRFVDRMGIESLDQLGEIEGTMDDARVVNGDLQVGV